MDNADETKKTMREKITENCKAHEGVVNCHGVYIDPEEKSISFDITLDFSIREKQKMCEMIREEIEANQGDGSPVQNEPENRPLFF
ncbi:MAG: hypothetical protein K6B69_00735 [Lachnospiraceae bacterium]|nr:hypothetical protein [Lachnospiraceae bacterium]